MDIEEAKKYLTGDPHYLSTAINQVAAEAFISGWNAAIEKCADAGDGIIVHSAEATNLITTIRNKILSLQTKPASKGRDVNEFR